jgi:Fe-S cluster assembly protein SufD
VSEPALSAPPRASGTAAIRPPSGTAAIRPPSGTAAAVSVHEHGATDRLAGPGTGRSAPPDARTARVASYDPADFAMPTGREEEWRFTPLDRLRPLLSGAPVEGKVVLDVDPAPEVTVGPIDRADPVLGSVLVPEDRLAALAFAGFDGGMLLRIGAGQVASRPTWVTVRGEGGTAYGHLVVDVGAQAEAVVVIDHVGSATFGANIEYRVGDGASLTVVSLQDWDADAVHVGAHAALVGRDARFRSAVVTLGGSLVRLTPTVRFAGPGGDAELLGLYFADAGQHLEHRLFVDHQPPHCRSRVTYKGALQGHDAHAVWIGDVLIGAGAEGTDTYELNRNLLLTDGARADSVPNLEIETGEITGAGHASATGRFDDEQLFYLQARGIPADLARRLVVRGFFADVINQIQVPELTDQLVAAIDAELERVGA